MRQTNSTLTFLSAQYRAVFKDAYIKGLASSAVISTAFLSTVSVGEVQATELTDLKQLQEEGADLTLATSGGQAQNFNVKGDLQWNADLKVTSSENWIPHTMTASYKPKSSLKGNGSLTLDATDESKKPVVAFDGQGGQYEFQIDLSKVNVNQGEIRLRSGYGSGRNVRLSANEINIDGGNKDKYAVVQIYGQAGTEDAGTSTLGRSDANITLKGAKSKIGFGGHTAENAKLEGNLTAEGGQLEFFHGDGTIRTRGTTTGTNVVIHQGKAGSDYINRGRTAVFDFDKTLAAVENTSAQLVMDKGTIEIQGFDKKEAGNDDNKVTGKAATMQVRQGTLELGSEMKIKSTKNNSGRVVVGSGNSSIQAKMMLQKQQLMAFLEGDKEPLPPDADQEKRAYKGRVELNKGGSLYLKRSEEQIAQNQAQKFDDIEFSNTINNSDGKVFVRHDEGTTVETDKLLVDKALSGAGAQHLNVKAEHITFKEHSGSGNAGYNFKRALASDVSFEAEGSDGEFNLHNEVQIAKVTQVNNPYVQGGAPIKFADQTSIKENVTLESGGKLQVAAGHVSTTGTIKVKDGTLGVGNAYEPDSRGVDATLSIKGNLDLTNNKSTTIAIQGNGSQAIATDKPNEPFNRPSRATLDLTAGKVNVTAHATNATTFHANQGNLVVNQDNFDSLLNTDGRRTGSNNKGAAIALENGSTLDIQQGDLRALSGGKSVGFDAAKIKQVANASQVQSDEIGLKGSGNKILANKVHLQGDAVDLGEGNTLQAHEEMVLDALQKPKATNFNTNIRDALAQARKALASAEQTLQTAKQSQDNKFTVKTGTVAVGSKLSATDKDQEIVIGNNGSNSVASLNLGFAQLQKDRLGRLSPEGAQGQLDSTTASAAAGQVANNLKLEGISENQQAKLNVVHGKWTAQNIDATKHAQINVGTAIEGMDPEQIQYAPESAPALNAKAVTLASGSNISISAPGKAHFESLDMQGGKMDIKGQMTVGSSALATSTPISFKSSGGDITVTGAHAKLELANSSLGGLKLKFDKDGKPTNLANIDPQDQYAKNISLSEQGTLKLDFDKDQLLTIDDINDLRKEFIKDESLDDNNNVKDGFLDVGNAKIADLKIENNKVDWDQLKPLTSLQGGISDVLTEELKKATLVNVPGNETVKANVGNIQVNAEPLNLDNTTLHNASGQNNNFIASKDDPNKALGATLISGANVGLYNGGKIGEMTLQAGKDNNQTTLTVAGDTTKITHIAAIRGHKDNSAGTKVSLNAPTKVANGITGIEELQINSDVTVTAGDGATNVKFLTSTSKPGSSSLNTNKLVVEGDKASNHGIDFAGNLKVSESAHFGDDTTLHGNNQFGDLSFEHRAHLARGTTYATNITIKSGNELVVGSDKSAHNPGSHATLVAKNMDLNGGTLIADPEYNDKASIVAIGTLGPKKTKAYDEASHLAQALAQAAANYQPNNAPQSIAAQLQQSNRAATYEAGNLDGKVVALQNSIVAIGVDANDIDQSVADLNQTFAPFLKNGALQDPKSNPQGVGAIAFVNKSVKLKNGSKIIADATKSYNQYQSSSHTYSADVHLGDNSALAISQDAGSNTNVAAINFEKPDAKIHAGKNAQVLITGENFNPNAPLKLFADGDGQVELTNAGNENLAVKTVNGLFELKDGLGNGKIDKELYLTMNPDKAKGLYQDVSRPVKETIMAYADKNNSQNLPHRQPLHGKRAPEVTYNEQSQQFTNAQGQNLNKADYIAIKNNQGAFEVFESANNSLLNNTITIAQGRDVEQVARLNDFGGSTKAAFEVATQSANAINSRMGMDNNGQNKAHVMASNYGSVWASPIYNKGKSKDLDAQGLDYGHDSELYGLSAGMDFNVNPNVQVGAMVNVGKGKMEGRQAASGVTNDVDFVGGGVYARVKQNNAQVVSDITYNQVKSDVSANTSLGKATAKHDSRVISAGVTGQYDLDVGGVQVSPHAGVRYTHINTEDHNIKLKGKNIASYKGKDMDIVSVPVGVKLSKNISADTWSIKPAVDLRVTANMGDIDHKGDVKWQGIENLSTPVNSAVLDRVTMGAGAGVQFTNGNFSAGAGVNYTTSKHADDLSVGANVEFKF